MIKVLSIKDLPFAQNVCEQQLREIFKTAIFSIAHVTMGVGAQSLLHKHFKMVEIYFIISGTGVLTHGATETKVSAGACIQIDPTVEHMLKNTGEEELVHFVIALPPFNPADIGLVNYQRDIAKFESFVLPETFVGLDGGRVYEFQSIQWRYLNMSLAYGYLEARQHAKEHYHRKTDEWYFICEGEGKAHLNGEALDVRSGDLIFVPIGTKHALENVSDSPMHVLCICEPEFKQEDFYFS